jgi:hypothetical protein
MGWLAGTNETPRAADRWAVWRSEGAVGVCSAMAFNLGPPPDGEGLAIRAPQALGGDPCPGYPHTIT